MNVLPLASVRWKHPSKLEIWRTFVQGTTFML
jgi:hypothetical protein